MYTVKFTWDKFAISVGAIFGNVEHVDWKFLSLSVKHKFSTKFPLTRTFSTCTVIRFK